MERYQHPARSSPPAGIVLTVNCKRSVPCRNKDRQAPTSLSSPQLTASTSPIPISPSSTRFSASISSPTPTLGRSTFHRRHPRQTSPRRQNQPLRGLPLYRRRPPVDPGHVFNRRLQRPRRRQHPKPQRLPAALNRGAPPSSQTAPPSRDLAAARDSCSPFSPAASPGSALLISRWTPADKTSAATTRDSPDAR